MTQEVLTFGCRLNGYESEVIGRHVKEAGIENAVVINSCAVTAEAERQLRQTIRKLKRENPDRQIILTGCAAQISPEKYAAMAEVDYILGNQEKLEASSYQSLLSQEEKLQVNDIMSVTETASHMVASFEGKARAFMQVQNGCNHRCTFCIIPYGRGNSRSVPFGEIVKQLRMLVAQNYQEVVLTGVDISDYGKDLPGGGPRFGEMVKRLLEAVPELPRLRLSSIDVAEIDEDLMDLLINEPRLMPYVHISLQAGDDMILKRMKRRHSRQEVLDFCTSLRLARPEVSFGADIIAGFPTEDEAMFKNTLALVAEAGLQFLHVFPYSAREGTPAAKMPQLPMAVRKQRAALLRQAGEEEKIKWYRRKIGQVEEVLVEKEKMARARDFSYIRLNKAMPAGTLVKVKYQSIKDDVIIAEVQSA